MQSKSFLGLALTALAAGAMAQNGTDSSTTDTAQPTTTVSLSPYQVRTSPISTATHINPIANPPPPQISVLQSEELSYATGTVLASLISVLQTEIPSSVFNEYTSVGFASLSAEFGSSFTAEPWFSDIDHVHTEVQNELQTLIYGVLNITANTTTVFATPTTGAATVTQANYTTSRFSSFSSATATPPSAVSASGPASTSSQAAAAMVTGGAKAVFGLAAAGLVGALL